MAKKTSKRKTLNILDKNKKLLTKRNTYDIINKLSLRQKQRTLITEQ